MVISNAIIAEITDNVILFLKQEKAKAKQWIAASISTHSLLSINDLRLMGIIAAP